MEEHALDVPVLIIVYKRLDTTLKVLECIRKARPKHLYVSSNAPNPNLTDDPKKVEAVRKAFDTQIDWPCEVHKLYRTEHLSAKHSISGGISWFFSHVKEGIILEDDCEVSPSFFPFCAEMLNRYRHNEKVFHISASNFQMGQNRAGEQSYFFSRYNHIWGWAGWRRSWEKFDITMKNLDLDSHRKALEKLFDRPQDRAYWEHLFRYVASGNLDTWDYQYMFTMWKHGGLGVIPKVNMVSNLGFGADATNSVDPNFALAGLAAEDLTFPLVHPKDVLVSEAADLYTSDFFFGISKAAKTGFLKVRVATLIPIERKKRIKKFLVRIKQAIKGK